MVENLLSENLNNKEMGRLFLRLANETYKNQTRRDILLSEETDKTKQLFQTHYVEMFQKRYGRINLEYNMDSETLENYLADNHEIMDNYLSDRPKGSICTILSDVLEKYSLEDGTEKIGEIIKNNPVLSTEYEKPGQSKKTRRKQVKYFKEIYNKLKDDLNSLI
jgi:hypothetical protein